MEKFGVLARFGFMHLMATNVSLWVRTVVWESANEWLHYLHQSQLQQQRHLSGGVASARSLPLSSPAGGAYPPVYDSDYAYFDDDFEVPAANNLDYISGNVAFGLLADGRYLRFTCAAFGRSSRCQADRYGRTAGAVNTTERDAHD